MVGHTPNAIFICTSSLFMRGMAADRVDSSRDNERSLLRILDISLGVN
jgi:hypothetical protein